MSVWEIHINPLDTLEKIDAEQNVATSLALNIHASGNHASRGNDL